LESVSNTVFPTRVLVVDDFEPWRRELRILLKERPSFRIIAEAAGGLEAVQMAQDMKPELILLDINLPDLNGIHAAQRINQSVPESKIVFLTQDSDGDILRVALATTALGYVLKIDAENELLEAMDAAVRGDQFISSGIRAANPQGWDDI
jgi:DNA-binding NarL/FixJ family response regulator